MRLALAPGDNLVVLVAVLDEPVLVAVLDVPALVAVLEEPVLAGLVVVRAALAVFLALIFNLDLFSIKIFFDKFFGFLYEKPVVFSQEKTLLHYSR